MGTTKQWLDPKGANVFTTVNPPEFVQANGTNFPVDGYAFDGAGASVEAMFFEVPVINYGSGNLTVFIDFYTSATTNATVWQGAISVTTPNDAQSMLTDAFATANAASAVTSNTTANGPSRATITITNLDSIATDDRMTLKIFRDPANAGDTNILDSVCFGVWIMWSDV